MVFVSFRMLIINSFTKNISNHLFTNNPHGRTGNPAWIISKIDWSRKTLKFDLAVSGDEKKIILGANKTGLHPAVVAWR